MNDRLTLEVELYRRALRAVTWLPVTRGLGPSDDMTVRARRYLPLAQATVGLAGALVFWTTDLLLPHAVALVLAFAAIVVLNGARGARGLGATVDGLTSGRRRQDVLLRMRLPGLDAPGALAIGLTMACNAAVLLSVPPVLTGLGLIVAPAWGSMARVHLKATTLPAREEGMKARIFEVTEDGYRVALLCSLVLCGPLFWAAGLWSTVGLILGAILAGQILRMILMRRCGGYTPEALAATQIIAESGALVGLAAFT